MANRGWTTFAALFVIFSFGTLSAQTIGTYQSSTAGTPVTSTTFSFTSANPTPTTTQKFNFKNSTGATIYTMGVLVTQVKPGAAMLLKYQCLTVANLTYFGACWKSLTGQQVFFLMTGGKAIAPGQNFSIQIGNLLGNKWDPASVFTVIANVPDPTLDPGVRLGDFNGDRMADLSWTNSSTAANQLWLMNGASVVSTLPLTITDATYTVAAVLDLNGDKLSDVLWQNTQTHALIAYINNGTSFDSFTISATSALYLAGTGDFDGDGKDDILWHDISNGANTIWFMDGAMIKSQAAAMTVADRTMEVVGVADFNGDFKADILLRNGSTGEATLYLMDGANCLGSASLGVVDPYTWQVGAVADFDGDGKAEVLWRQVSGGNYMWKVVDMAVVGAASQPMPNLTWQIAAVGDLNGDGMADIVWRNVTNGQNTIWFMNGPTVVSTALTTTLGTKWNLF